MIHLLWVLVIKGTNGPHATSRSCFMIYSKSSPRLREEGRWSSRGFRPLPYLSVVPWTLPDPPGQCRVHLFNVCSPHIQLSKNFFRIWGGVSLMLPYIESLIPISSIFWTSEMELFSFMGMKNLSLLWNKSVAIWSIASPQLLLPGVCLERRI